MSKNDYDRGVRDGEHNTYNPPHDQGLIADLIVGKTEKEIEDRTDYRQGYRHGKD